MRSVATRGPSAEESCTSEKVAAATSISRSIQSEAMIKVSLGPTGPATTKGEDDEGSLKRPSTKRGAERVGGPKPLWHERLQSASVRRIGGDSTSPRRSASTFSKVKYTAADLYFPLRKAAPT